MYNSFSLNLFSLGTGMIWSIQIPKQKPTDLEQVLVQRCLQKCAMLNFIFCTYMDGGVQDVCILYGINMFCDSNSSPRLTSTIFITKNVTCF